MPFGRPSIYSDELAERICERLTCGEPLARICDDPEMPTYSTVRKWQHEKADFSALSTQAREAGTHYVADDCFRIADDPSLDPADKRIRIDTRLRLIGKWNAKKYGDKLDLNHSGKVETQPALDLSVLSHEEKVQMLALMERATAAKK